MREFGEPVSVELACRFMHCVMLHGLESNNSSIWIPTEIKLISTRLRQLRLVPQDGSYYGTTEA